MKKCGCSIYVSLMLRHSDAIKQEKNGLQHNYFGKHSILKKIKFNVSKYYAFT